MKAFVQNAIPLIACSLMLTVPALAQLEGNPENLCRNGSLPQESKNYRLAKIRGVAGDKVYFYGNSHERCPGDESCRLKSYVIPNNELIVSRTLGKFACSWFQPRKGSETVGWIESDRLEWIDTNQQPPERDWLGEWRAYDDHSIRISKGNSAGVLVIKGNASWGKGAYAHVGELDYTATPSGDRVSFGDGTHENDCQVAMQLLGKYLVVGDNVRCGGVNVSFSGIYRKRPKR